MGTVIEVGLQGEAGEGQIFEVFGAEALNTTRGLNIRWCERELSKEIKGG